MLFPIFDNIKPINIEKLSESEIQNEYEQIINMLDLSLIVCKECGNIGFHIHSYYVRGIIIGMLLVIRIARIKCTRCNKTHAILPQWLVPYSRIPLKTTVEIIRLKEKKEIDLFLETKTYLAEDAIKMIKDKYKKYWKQRLISQNIKINDMLSNACLDLFGYQFMQIRYPSTIAYRQYHIGCPITLFSP